MDVTCLQGCVRVRVYMWVRPHLSVFVRYPSVCPVMKAVSIRTNPTISTSRGNDRDIFTTSVTEGRRKGKSEEGVLGEYGKNE